MKTLLTVRNLCYQYPDGHEALKGVSFDISEGEKIALVGANGSGKSTLLLLLAGAIEQSSGEIFFRDSDDSETRRRQTGLIFQDADDQILMPTVIEDVAFSPVAYGMNVKDAHALAMKILSSLGIEHLAFRVPHKLSGGEKRMATFAGILAASPELLLLDEPTSALDPAARRRVINFLKQTQTAFLLATHDLDMACEVCESALIMSHGNITASGKLPELFRDEKILAENNLKA
ncbi:MAG: energy-coupling factor ABC transporter ATP-binding protein [Synergistaceae bacterium]|nr:energy-coupling factor ABC transporter ATP-binding protein [Synergistaceae bacterium]